MLRRIKIENYRVLRDVDCSLSPFTCLAGSNGCGKSTLLEVLEEAIPSAVNGKALAEGTPSTNTCVDLALGVEGEVETIVFRSRRWDGGSTSSILRGGAPVEGVELDKIRDKWPMVVRPRFTIQALRESSPVLMEGGVLSHDGSGLAALLADWKLEDDPRLDAVISQLNRVVPQVRGLSPFREKGRYSLHFLVGPTRRKIPARDMSTGTLYALALLTHVQSLGGRPALVLLDDLDHDLHPQAQGELTDYLLGLVASRPELQIIATSHSPYLLDHMPSSGVRLMTLDDEGFGCLAPMNDHPEHSRLRSIMRPGEFWSAVGERWILKAPHRTTDGEPTPLPGEKI